MNGKARSECAENLFFSIASTIDRPQPITTSAVLLRENTTLRADLLAMRKAVAEALNLAARGRRSQRSPLPARRVAAYPHVTPMPYADARSTSQSSQQESQFPSSSSVQTTAGGRVSSLDRESRGTEGPKASPLKGRPTAFPSSSKRQQSPPTLPTGSRKDSVQFGFGETAMASREEPPVLSFHTNLSAGNARYKTPINPRVGPTWHH